MGKSNHENWRQRRILLEVLKGRRKRARRIAHDNRNINHVKKPYRTAAREQRLSGPPICEIIAPAHLSLVTNPEETLRFIKKLDNCYKERRSVWVDLSEVEKLSLNGILVLLSVMVAFLSKKIPFNGNKPFNELAKKRLDDSGFFDYLYRKIETKKEYVIKSRDTISTHAAKVVDAPLADELLTEASEVVWGDKRRCIGAQKILVELMGNTNNHASFKGKGEKLWWLCSSLDEANKKACFAFVDYGVGVFESLNNKSDGWKLMDSFRQLKERLRFGSNADILMEILKGKLHRTSTKEAYRGRGLPSIYSAAIERKSVKNLHIITNGVSFNQNENNCHKLGSDFSGTFIYFELEEDCHNLNYE